MGLMQQITYMANRASLQTLRGEVKQELDASGKESSEGFAQHWETAVDRIKEKLRSLAEALGVIVSVAELIEFGKKSIESFSEAEAASVSLAQTMRNLGIEVENAEGAIQNLEAANRKLGITNVETDRSFQTLLIKTGSFSTSMRAMPTAIALTRLGLGDLSNSTRMLTNALDGHTDRLARYIGQLDKSRPILEQIEERVKGLNEAFSNTVAGKTAAIAAEWDRFREAVGAALISAGNGKSVLDTLTAAVIGATDWFRENQATVREWGTAIQFVFAQAVTITHGFIGMWQGLQTAMDVVVANVKLVPITMQQVAGDVGIILANFLSKIDVLVAIFTGAPIKVVDSMIDKLRVKSRQLQQDALTDVARLQKQLDDAASGGTSEDTGIRGHGAPGDGSGRARNKQKDDEALAAMQAITAELTKQHDAEDVLNGITNKQIEQYKVRLALTKEQEATLRRQESLLLQTIRTGTLSDQARTAALAKLKAMVDQSKSLQDEAKQLLDMIRYHSNVVLGSPNNLGGKAGDLSNQGATQSRAQGEFGTLGAGVANNNEGVNAANNPANNGAILGHNSGMSGDDITAGRMEAHQKLVDRLTTTVDRYAAAWRSVFAAIASGTSPLKAIAQATLGMIGEIAGGLAKMEISKGIAHLAEGTWPPNPVAIRAASLNFLAAAGFEALAGLSGAASGGGSGGGSGAGASTSGAGGYSQYGTQAALKAAQKSPPINITVNAFDKRNPVHQNELGDAIVQFAERTGAKIMIGGTR